MDTLKDTDGIIQLPVVAQQKHTLAGKLEISTNGVLNYHAGTGSGNTIVPTHAQSGCLSGS